MFRWKNKSIHSLSKDELRQALSESVSLLLLEDRKVETTDTLPVFATGLFAGVFIALFGLVIAMQL